MDIINSISNLAESYALFLVPIVLGLTQVFKQSIPDEISGKAAPVIALLLGIVGALVVIGPTRQSAVVGVIIGLMAGGSYSGFRAITAKTGDKGHARISVLARLLLICVLVVSIIGCAMGPAVQLTPDEQTRVSVSTYEANFMTFYRAAHNYVAANPQYKDTWNTVIQPAFSKAHITLALYEKQLLGGTISQAEMQAYINGLTDQLTSMMLSIGWVK